MSAQEPAASSAAAEDDTVDNWDDDDSTDGENGAEDETSSDDEKSDSSSDDETASKGDYQSQVLNSYRKLLSRRVDLVGDYAGDELFLIEGDSLLLRCFSDHRLDFDTGFQMLHAAFNVEHFLHNLTKRKCNFHIIFFDCNRELCVPPNTDPANACKYHLARAAIIRHLQANLTKSHPDIAVKVFSTYDAPQFADYLRASSPYFVMMHDGAQPEKRRLKHNSDSVTETSPSTQRVGLRGMILTFISQGYNVALINDLEWRDTKVMTMVLEARHRNFSSQQIPSKAPQPESAPMLDVSAELQKLSGVADDLTERQRLAVVAVSSVLRAPPSGLSKPELPSLCSSFLMHEALLAHLPLSARRNDSQDGADGAQDILRAITAKSEAILRSADWTTSCENSPSSKSACDVVDCIDGRLFLHVSYGQGPQDKNVQETLKGLLAAVQQVSGTAISIDEEKRAPTAATNGHATNAEPTSNNLAVLPFSNPVFDKHLEPVHLKIDEAVADQQTYTSHRIFQELTHWHNAKKPIIVKAPPTRAEEKAAFWAAKRNQLFMAEMRTYAASLTNAVGKSLEPESIIVGATKPSGSNTPKAGLQSPADSDGDDSGASTPKGKPAPKKGGAGGKSGGKTAAKNAGKQAMLAQIAESKAKKEESAGGKVVSAWQLVCKNFQADSDPRSRFRRARFYLTNLQSETREIIGAEAELYVLSCVLQYWIDASRRKEQVERIEVCALIWNLAGSITKSKGLTKTIVSNVELTVKTLGLPPVPQVNTDTLPDRKLAFTFALPAKADSLAINIPPKEFQLLHCGPYLERSFDSRPDSRVEFNPDGWQRRVLDGIDANQSVFVVAPTSAGKTFISFYAMRKVLEADDDGVLVYVAPTKALVNQIAAEIQARYSKKFKYGGKSVWAIHTRDYRINSPTGCQVLVTVPHVLQIMLLAPSNANSWSSRVKRIIFDEVHSIGQAEDGVVWEQLLLMAPCPIIALSATVGNPEEFSGWLTDTQRAIGIDLVTVQHPHRYSDLRKYYYVPPKRFDFHGIPEKTAFGTLGLEGLTGFNHLHPVAALVDKSRGIPEDLGLEPRDCLELWQAMSKLQNEQFPVSESLSPEKALPAVLRKMDILNWEKGLKNLLREWIADDASPYERLVKELEQSFRNEERDPLQVTQPTTEGDAPKAITINDESDLLKTTLPMLCRLHAQDALPAILFNYDRHMCEKICQTIVEQLQQAELTQRKTGPKWQKTLERWEEWKKVQAKQAKALGKKGKNQDDDKVSKLDQQKDAADANASAWDSFNPEAPADGYHFADHTKVQLSELEIYVRQLGKRNIQQWLIDAITRGIGVHHAGMNRKYRQIVEILFRKGFLRVVIATGTLALGINMPCKTVVFSGDSVFLTALNYRQCAGRAGRRGFDLLGNVVFAGVSRQKVCRLISSRLPDLNGHFPITTTLVLRLFTLLHESKNSKYAVGAINALLSQPRLYMGGPSFKDQTMHHLRFSIEYLRRQHLLATNGAPLNFAGLVSHLYFTENSSFAFHALLKEGFFHELCAGINKSEKSTLETLMLVMAHLFNRIYCRQADPEYREKVVKPSSSIVFLPPLPNKASEILRQHNKQTLHVYKTYVETFVDQHVKNNDNKLPLSGMQAGGDDSEMDELSQAMPQTKIRSPFVALSGAGDTFDSIHDLCTTTRDGVFLEEAVIPHVDIYPDEMDMPLNAWLLDFFKHGDIFTIERANGVRRADIWFLLNDFSLVLATIITSLLNFMKLKEGTDMDMLDVMGDLDMHDEAEENDVAASEEQSEVSAPSAADSAISMPDRPKTVTKKKAKNTESWEEVADEEDEANKQNERRAANAARLEAEAGQALENENGTNQQGLKDVLKAFQKLHAEFNVKFRAMWA